MSQIISKFLLTFCINKYDLDEMITMSIEQLCRAQDVPVLAKIPFDPEIMQALQNNMTPIQAGVLTYQQPVEQLWNKLKKEIEQKCSEKTDNRKTDMLVENHPLNQIKRTVAVLSGKGGVGKSLITALLAVYMAAAPANIELVSWTLI